MNILTEFPRSVDQRISNETLTAIATAYDAAASLIKGDEVAVIAGGSIRDVVYGSPPEDLDIFIDLGIIDLDELDDASVVFTDKFHELVAPRLALTPFYKLDGPKYIDAFAVFHMDHIEFDGPAVQLIFKPFGTKANLLAEFDYDLVEGYYDGQLRVTDAFLKAVDTLDVNFKTFQAYDRYTSWVTRDLRLPRFNPVLPKEVDQPKPRRGLSAKATGYGAFFADPLAPPVAGFEGLRMAGDRDEVNDDIIAEIQRIIANRPDLRPINIEPVPVEWGGLPAQGD